MTRPLNVPGLKSSLLLSVLLGVVWAASQIVGAQERPQYSADGIEVPGAKSDEPRIEWSKSRGLEHLDDAALAWGSSRKCVSCHTNGTYLLIRPIMTPSVGAPDRKIRDFFVRQLEEIRRLDPEKAKTQGTRAAQVIYIAAGLAQWDRYVAKRLSVETEEAIDLMFEMQGESGSWHNLDCWPPFESHPYSLAQTAAMALASAPGWLQKQDGGGTHAEAVSRLRDFLKTSELPHDYARVLKLWSALQLDGILTESEKRAFVKMILDKQQADGGWTMRTFATPEQWGQGSRASKLRDEPAEEQSNSDGHMTGLVLWVLTESGLGVENEQIRRGIAWLKDNQRESGRWWTRSLNTDQSHYITYSGTAYAMAVLSRFE